MKTPPPGSPEAEELGCKCPVLDNAHGHGYMGQQGIYVYSAACKLHASRPDIDDALDSFNRDCADAADEFEQSTETKL